tara:strand:- start:467 stop:811 length:345 start_codon:yes stop_codon:yes gene_type:complete
MEELEQFINQKIWLIFGMVILAMFKDVIGGIVAGILIFASNELNTDDIVYLSGRKARVTRVGLFSTIFFMADTMCKMRVPNTQLKELTIEKPLPTNGYKYKKDNQAHKNRVKDD